MYHPIPQCTGALPTILRGTTSHKTTTKLKGQAIPATPGIPGQPNHGLASSSSSSSSSSSYTSSSSISRPTMIPKHDILQKLSPLFRQSKQNRPYSSSSSSSSSSPPPPPPPSPHPPPSQSAGPPTTPLTSKVAYNSASSSKNFSSRSIHSAASESQHLPSPLKRAKYVSELLHLDTAPTKATKTYSVASGESASFSAHHGSPATLSTPADRSESTSGTSDAPETVGISGVESNNLPQKNGPSAGMEGRTDAKPSSSGSDGQYSRDRDRLHTDWGRSPDLESDGDWHRYRRDYRDRRHNHRLHSKHLSPHDRHNRDWDSERRYERTVHHPRESYRARSSHHDHRHRSRDDTDFERTGDGRSNREEFRIRWRWPQESRESRVTGEKRNARERNSYPSKKETSLLATVSDTSAIDWDSERHYERTVHHPRESYRDRSPHHYHRHRSRDDTDFERTGDSRSNLKEFRIRWRWPQESRESRVTGEKRNARERNS
ncbi:unnamed protein product [Pleuronectes platessa]|uniref:Uncharacterized protein n=1 Tax=Pleuronectes platessa TaxID=8262 RepID=A0A9N7V660_PLEPL|nr:unnamed protein product [Pleuronectes platessa]